MHILKSTSKSDDGSGQPNKGRRSFIWKAGAGISAILAAAVPGIAGTRINNTEDLKTKVDRLSREVGILEDEKNIRELYQSYENLLDKGIYEEVVDLFTDDAEVVFNGGVFRGKNRGITRLYRNNFSSGATGKKMGFVPCFQLDTEEQEDVVEVSRNRKSARARFSYSIQVGTPIISDSVLVKMARLQGEGIMKWWEGGTYEISCVKNPKNGKWKIKRLEYNTLARADYKPAKAYAKPVDIPLYSKTYPEDQAGPDRLVKQG